MAAANLDKLWALEWSESKELLKIMDAAKEIVINSLNPIGSFRNCENIHFIRCIPAMLLPYYLEF